ncbi:protein of unknown function [Burkholderia multivorans]
MDVRFVWNMQFHIRRARFSGTQASEAGLLTDAETGNALLKTVQADAMPDIQAFQVIVTRQIDPTQLMSINWRKGESCVSRVIGENTSISLSGTATKRRVN